MAWKTLVLAVFLVSPSLISAQENVLIVNIRQRPPEMVVEGDKYSGPLLDVIKEAAQKVGYDVKFVDRQFEASITLLQQGDESVQIIPRTMCTEERAALVDFIGPIGYLNTDVVFLVKPGQEDTIKTFDDLKKVKVGTKRGSFFFKEFNDSKEITKVESDDDDNMVRMFAAGRFDAMIIFDKTAAETALKKHNITEYAYATYRQPVRRGVYFAMTQNHKARDMMQKALEEMVHSGRIAEIYKSHNAEPPPFDPAVGFERCFNDF
jgi:polar amino acid transport system substrate-binding protein